MIYYVDIKTTVHQSILKFL